MNYSIGKATSLGPAALSTETTFDEIQLLEESSPYIVASLGLVDGIMIFNADDEAAEDPGGVRGAAEPGSPSFSLM